MNKRWLIISLIACMLCVFGGVLAGKSFGADYSSFFKNDKVVTMAIKKAEDEKIDTATVVTKSGKCYQFQLQKGKVLAWKTCKDTEWKTK